MYILLRIKVSQLLSHPTMPKKDRLAVFFCGLDELVLGWEPEVWDPSVIFPSVGASTEPFIFSVL